MVGDKHLRGRRSWDGSCYGLADETVGSLSHTFGSSGAMASAPLPSSAENWHFRTGRP